MASCSSASSIPKFYLNVVLLNKDEVVRGKVQEKTGMKAGGFFTKAVGYAANKLVTDETVINGLASNLKEKIEAAVAEMGITAEVNKVFQKGPYVVVAVQITNVDKLTLLLAAKGEDFASQFSTLLATISALGLGETALPKIDEKIHSQIHDAMMRKFSEMIPQKMHEAGLEIDCRVCTREDQADHFYDALQSLESH